MLLARAENAIESEVEAALDSADECCWRMLLIGTELTIKNVRSWAAIGG